MSIKKKDLIEGEYYVQNLNSDSLGIHYIFKKGTTKAVERGGSYLNNWDSNGFRGILRLATSEEKHWLKECIKADKFILKSEAMKSFKVDYTGRYIKALIDNPQGGNSVKKGDIGIFINNGEYLDFPEFKGYNCFNWQKYPDKYELMPEDYKPESVTESKEFKDTFFNKGDYVVVTKHDERGYNGKLNYCYKCIDKSTYNGVFYFNHSNSIPFDCKDIEGRYATPEEIAEYDRQGEPYNVTNLKQQIVKPAELTSLPEKWCVAVTKENVKVLEDWRKHGANSLPYHYGYLDHFKTWCKTKDDCTEITFEQFKKWILKEDPTESLLEEAKRRYPIGTMFYPIHESGKMSDNLQKQTKECYIYGDWIIGSANIMNPNGTWAKIVSTPEVKTEDWIPQVGDWITITGCYDSDDSDDNWNEEMDDFIGSTTQITSINSKDWFKCNNLDSGAWNWEYSNKVKHFRKAYADEIPYERKSKPLLQSLITDYISNPTPLDYSITSKIVNDFLKDLDIRKTYPCTVEESFEGKILNPIEPILIKSRKETKSKTLVL